MAKPPTKLSYLIDYRSSRRTYRALADAGLLTPEADRNRQEILRDLDQCIARPPSNTMLGARSMNDEFIEVLWSYLNEEGQDMATDTTGLPPPPKPRRSWWRFWTWFRPLRPAAHPPIPADGRILFYKRDRAEFGFLSNFHPAPFLWQGWIWPTAEHYYQAQKGYEQEYQIAVRDAATPGQAKRLGAAPDGPRKASKHSWFRKNSKTPKLNWNTEKLNVMRQAVTAKFDQNPDLAARLRATGTAELIEDSTTDTFWGIGPDGTGQNWLGKVLMETRAKLR